MIRLHHLNQSRSLRILWLLEEIGQPYELVAYQRDAETSLAPDSLKQVHPLGKSPVIDIDGHVIAESGAITQYLIEQFAADSLRPSMESIEYAQYLQWMDFAESSLMLPLLLGVFTQKAGINDNEFLTGYMDSEKSKVLSYLDDSLKDKTFIVGDKLSGADFMLSFDIIMLDQRGELEDYKHIQSYAQRLASLDSFKRAMKIEAEHDSSK